MRIGISGGVSGRADNAVTELVDAARQAHQNGLDYWLAQLTDIDALTALAVVGREVPGLEVGTAVVPTYPRHPLVMAMQALTVQAATGNHLTLGIGLSHQVVIEGAYGISFATPVRHMREYLSVLMPLLHEGKTTFEGEEITARTFAPVRVAGARPPTVLVAALGTQMLKLAGRLADGTILWMVGPKTIADHIVPTITKAAEAAGRPAPEVTVGLPVCVTNQPAEAAEKAATVFGLYDNLPSYKAMLDREGVDGPAGVAIIGDEQSVAARLHQLGELGATRLTMSVFGNSEERARATALLRELAAGA